MANTMSQKCRNLLFGRFPDEDLPSGKSNLVRVYLCSVGPDSVTERNALVESVYPRLREYCRDEHGLECQIVDLNWGFPSNRLDDEPNLIAIREREIEKCLQMSVGPSFITFLGQKYGPRALPDVIPQEDFDSLQLALHVHRGRDTRTAALLDHCYFLDENNIPPVYVLKERVTLVPSLSDNNESVRQEARTKWVELKNELIRLIHKGAELACIDGHMDHETAERYFLSELENQVLLGTEVNDLTDERCVMITRNIQDLNNYTQDIRAQTFTDIRYDDKREMYEVDVEAANLMIKMKNKVASLVSSNNTIYYDVLWRYETVIDPKLHFDYLQSLCEDVFTVCCRLIDERSLTQNEECCQSCICKEVELHWRRCHDLSLNLCNNVQVMSSLQEYMSGSLTTPLIVFGESGCGKSTIVSKMAWQMQETLASEFMVAVRYIGDIDKSSDIGNILVTLCRQVTKALGDSIDVASEVTDLAKFFLKFLTLFPANLGLVIILDGIENLLPDHAAFTFNWLPKILSRNVRIILTVDSTAHGLLNRLREEVLPQSPSSFLQVPPICVRDCQELFLQTLSAMNRCLTVGQSQEFFAAIEKEPTPFFVECLVNIAKDLSSITKAPNLPCSSHEAITSLFDTLEAKHGHMLVFRSFAYMAASLTGLSDCEMEDLLSLDEDVLNEIFQDYHPPVRRVPCIRWLALKQDVHIFLVHKLVDDITVSTWKHEICNEIVARRFLGDVTVAAMIHSNMADYFLGTWNGRSKPAVVPKTVEIAGVLFSTDRKVPSQPHTFGHPERWFNKRMYQQVPRHLDLAGRHNELKCLVLFNYEWLYNKTKALSLQHVLADLSLNPGEDVNVVREVLKLSESVIKQDINNLPVEITAHLLPYYSIHANIRSLIKQCDTTGLKHCSLVPNFSYHHVPGGPLQFTLPCPPKVELDHFLLIHGDRYLMCKQRDDTYVHTYDLIKGSPSTSVLASVGELYTTPNGKFLILVDHVTQKAIKIHEADTGTFLKQIILMNYIEGKSSSYRKGPLCVTDDRLCAIVTLTNSVLCVCDIPSGNVLSIIPLEGKCGLCTMTPDGRRVFINSNDFLMAFDVYTQTLVMTAPTDGKPFTIAFSHDGLRVFLSNNMDAKVTVMHCSDGVIDVSYRLAFDEQMPGDCVHSQKISPDDSMLLIRGSRTLVVQHRSLEKVLAVFKPPRDNSSDDRPHHQQSPGFVEAEFTRDSSCVIGAMARNVHVWKISSNQLLSVINGQLGDIRTMLVSRSLDQVITHRENSKDIQVWNVSDGVRKIVSLDKLGSAVTEFQLSSDNRLLFVKCRQSSDLGIIDMNNGCLLQVLAQGAIVQDLAVSPDGNWVLVSSNEKLSGATFKLWNVNKNSVVFECGDVAGYCVGTSCLPCIIMVAQKDKSFRAPYNIAMFRLTDVDFHVPTYFESCIQTVKSKPFVTFSDEYLILNSAMNLDTDGETHAQPCLQIFQVKTGTHLKTWTASDMNFQQHLLDILEVRPCRQQNNANLVAGIFSCKDIDSCTPSSCRSHNKTVHTFGFFLLDASTGSLTLLCIPFPRVSYGLNAFPLIFSPDCRICIDSMSNIFHIPSEEFITQVPSHLIPPRALALQGRVVVYYSNTMILVTRVIDGATIGRVQVRSPICHLHVCSDHRTLLVGCEDGAVLCYTIIDTAIDDPAEILGLIASRRVEYDANSLKYSQHINSEHGRPYST